MVYVAQEEVEVGGDELLPVGLLHGASPRLLLPSEVAHSVPVPLQLGHQLLHSAAILIGLRRQLGQFLVHLLVGRKLKNIAKKHTN